MKNENAIESYKEACIGSAPPLKVVRLLYQGAIRFIDQARQLDVSRSPAEFNTKIGRAAGIVTELRASLVHEHVPELSHKIESLYGFVQERLDAAVLERDPAPLADARLILSKLLDGWAAIDLSPADGA